MSPAELHDRISRDAAGALRELQERTSVPGAADWDDALNLISDTVRDQPTDGLLDADSGDPPGLLGAVVRGWGAATPGAATAETIIAWLSKTRLSAASWEIADLLAAARHEAGSAEWHQVPGARDLATRVWAIAGRAVADLDAGNWAARALNHPAGQLAQFWVKAVAADWAARS